MVSTILVGGCHIIGTPTIANEVHKVSLLARQLRLLLLFELGYELFQSAAKVQQSHSQDEEAASIDEAYESEACA